MATVARRSLHVTSLPQAARRLRRPQHPFYIEQRPWQIQPFMIAPVLPGETMKNLLCQTRSVSDPILNPLIGWWCEQYFFYVKHRDLDDRDTFTAMMLDPSTSLAGLFTAADAATYHGGTGGSRMNWLLKCLKRIVECYFRNDGEAWNTWLIDTLPVAQITGNTVLDSARTDTDWLSADVDVEGPDANSTIQASEVEIAMRTWQFLRGEGLTEMTYEDYLATYGVRPDKQRLNMPELVRYVKEWTYPSSTINPSTGAPTSAVSWKVSERADKDRYFAEPGFIIGCQVVRPKVYLGNMDGSFTSSMITAQAWLPAVMNNDNFHSWLKGTALKSPLKANTLDYWIDIKDLLLYGEQFLNISMATTGKNIIGLPTAALQKRYPTGTDADLMFVGASPANKIRSDGVVSLSILGTQTDTSPTR